MLRFSWYYFQSILAQLTQLCLLEQPSPDVEPWIDPQSRFTIIRNRIEPTTLAIFLRGNRRLKCLDASQTVGAFTQVLANPIATGLVDCSTMKVL
jgi:hypothetical protein